MKTIGFIKSNKENEKRIALLPNDIKNIKNKSMLFFEKNYGIDLGIDDEKYIKAGSNVVEKDIVLKQDIICDPKIGDSTYLDKIKNKTIFGWIHAVQNKDITNTLINNKLTAYAWEDMFELGRHVFWKNNELAGEAAVMHALTIFGEIPRGLKVAILGNGNTARGAFRVLTQLGANIQVYTRKMEEMFKREIEKYDIIVNAILWDTAREDHIIYKKDLKKMKKNALIIDISCDRNGAIETSIPTTIEKPTYSIDGITHYVVDHTPSLIYKTTSREISKATYKFIDYLVEEKENEVLKNALATKDGITIDKRINEFQNRK